LSLALICLSTSYAIGQIEFTGAATKWADSYRDWEFYSDVDTFQTTGELTLRWPMKKKWSEWDFRFGEITGQIKASIADQPTDWTLMSEGETVRIQSRWPGDMSQWRIQHKDTTLILELINPNLPEEWVIELNDTSFFQVYTFEEGNLTEWEVYEEGKSLSTIQKLAALFIAIFSVVPHY